MTKLSPHSQDGTFRIRMYRKRVRSSAFVLSTGFLAIIRDFSDVCGFNYVFGIEFSSVSHRSIIGKGMNCRCRIAFVTSFSFTLPLIL